MIIDKIMIIFGALCIWQFISTINPLFFTKKEKQRIDIPNYQRSDHVDVYTYRSFDMSIQSGVVSPYLGLKRQRVGGCECALN